LRSKRNTHTELHRDPAAAAASLAGTGREQGTPERQQLLRVRGRGERRRDGETGTADEEREREERDTSLVVP